MRDQESLASGNPQSDNPYLIRQDNWRDQDPLDPQSSIEVDLTIVESSSNLNDLGTFQRFDNAI